MSENSFTKSIKIAFITNIFVEIGITLMAIGFIDGYLTGLIDITEKTIDSLIIVIFLIIIVVLFIGLLGYVLFDFIFVQYKEKTRSFVVGLMIISSIVILFTGMLWIYGTFSPGYPILQDPFALSSFSTVLADLYLVWWFVGFFMSMLIISFVLVTTFWAFGV